MRIAFLYIYSGNFDYCYYRIAERRPLRRGVTSGMAQWVEAPYSGDSEYLGHPTSLMLFLKKARGMGLVRVEIFKDIIES